MAELFKGKVVVEALEKELTDKIASFKRKPMLAILRVGENDGDLSYERSAIKKAEKLGINHKEVSLPADVDYDVFYKELEKLNNDDNVDGLLMLRPLPNYLDNEKARKLLDPNKDIDGCTDGSLAGVFTNSGLGFAPCTAEAALAILKYYGVELSGKKVCMIGRSLVIGRPLSMLLLHENCTVTICHTKTVNIQEISKNSDIVIVATGKAEQVGIDYFRNDQSQIVIDVGINYSDEKQKLVGDVDFDKVEPLVKAITPVPGGVGNVTSTILMKHVVEAYKRKVD